MIKNLAIVFVVAVGFVSCTNESRPDEIDDDKDTISIPTKDPDHDAGVDAAFAPDCADGFGKLDVETNLCWQQQSTSEDYNWQQAIDYCDALDLGGYDDWSLPERQNFIDILEECDPDTVLSNEAGYCETCADSAACSLLFGEENRCHWSSSIDAENDRRWTIYLGWGRILRVPEEQKYSVRCIR